jgi:hypothetical protein
MSKAPKQRKAQLHYQPYQSSGGATVRVRIEWWTRKMVMAS